MPYTFDVPKHKCDRVTKLAAQITEYEAKLRDLYAELDQVLSDTTLPPTSLANKVLNAMQIGVPTRAFPIATATSMSISVVRAMLTRLTHEGFVLHLGRGEYMRPTPRYAASVEQKAKRDGRASRGF